MSTVNVSKKLTLKRKAAKNNSYESRRKKIKRQEKYKDKMKEWKNIVIKKLIVNNKI